MGAVGDNDNKKINVSANIVNISVKREGDPKGWSTVLITALGSWGKH
jgi:hypothetical protein